MVVDTNMILGFCSGAVIIITAAEKIYGIVNKPKAKMEKRNKEVEKRLTKLEDLIPDIQEQVKCSKEERRILCEGLLAALKGLQEQGCNGPVTKGIAKLEEYLLDSSHE